MATIRQRHGNQWEAQVRRYGWPTATKSFRTKAEACDWAATIESEITRGVYADRSEAERTTLSDLLEQYLEKITPQKKGAASEAYRIKSLLRDPIAQIKLSLLTSKVIATWRDERLTKVSGSTVNRDLNLISHVINIGRKEWGLVIENPIAMIRRPKKNKARKRRLTALEEINLLRALEPSPRNKMGRFTGVQNIWMKPLVILAIETGMRRSELLGLLWHNIYLEERYVHLRDTKNNESRDVPLSTRAVFVLSELPRRESERVFPITGDAVKKAFGRAVSSTGIVDLHFHDLRHEATSRLATKFDNVLQLAAVTGHKTLSMLARYYHPRATDLAKKLD